MGISDFLSYKMLSAIRSSHCANCNKNLTDNSIIATGVRKTESSSVPYIEYLCSCGHRGIAIFTENYSYDLYEFCYEIVMNVANRRQLEKCKFLEHKYIKNKMTTDEINDFIKFVRESDNHQEFLKHIGSESDENTNNQDGKELK